MRLLCAQITTTFTAIDELSYDTKKTLHFNALLHKIRTYLFVL